MNILHILEQNSASTTTALLHPFGKYPYRCGWSFILCSTVLYPYSMYALIVAAVTMLDANPKYIVISIEDAVIMANIWITVKGTDLLNSCARGGGGGKGWGGGGGGETRLCWL